LREAGASWIAEPGLHLMNRVDQSPDWPLDRFIGIDCPKPAID
jgi:hypothetical protein